MCEKCKSFMHRKPNILNNVTKHIWSDYLEIKKYALHRWKRPHLYSALVRLYTFFVNR